MKTKIKPFTNQIYIKMDEAMAGALDTSSRESAVEYAEVLALGEGTEGGLIKVGSRIFVKSWGIDSVHHQDVRYNFINVTTGAILAVVE